MKTVGNYAIIETFRDPSAFSIHRAVHRESNSAVILKEFRKDRQSSFRFAQLSHEYRMLMDYQIDGIVGIQDFFETDSRFFLIQEDFDGVSLRAIIEGGVFDIGFFLDLAINISETLGQLHRNNVIHGNLKPESILVDVKTRKAKITDIGFPSPLETEPALVRDANFIRRNLCYISPEQTGRIARDLDYRTDFYSLGVTFYEMLTGNVPFLSLDALELMFSHIAREAIAPSQKMGSVFEPLSAIVMKLLSKTAEDRYQSSVGLIADLQHCRQQLQERGAIAPFELARGDVSIRFLPPTALFGRDVEVAELKSGYELVARGKNLLTLVAGSPGIGKSTLVYEMQQDFVGRGGRFISGKYDSQTKDVPLSSITKAFGVLFQQIMTESQDKIEQWRERFFLAVGSLGKIITDVIPEVEQVVGQQAEVAELGPDESQNRFNLTMKKFVQALTSRDHPLVLFLDDLQWADLASLRLIETLITDGEIQYFYLIGTYRDNEVGQDHPLAQIISDLKSRQVDLHQLTLAPLDEDCVRSLVASFLGCDLVRAAEVASVVYEKTGGNPFFVHQYLKTMYESDMLELDPSTGWRWNLQAIRQMQMADNVVDLVIEKISRLESESKNILQVAACIGMQFGFDILAAISGDSIDDIVDSLSSLVAQGLISRQDYGYRFNHDRIHEAALSMVPQIERDRYQYATGRYLLDHSSEQGVQDRALEIVNKLNGVTEMVRTETERLELAALNLIAARKAASASAYGTALFCCQAGLELLGENCWQDNYDLSLALSLLAAESAYISTDYGEQERISTAVLSNAASLMDTIRIYELKIQSFTAQNNLASAIETGREVLGLLGLKFPLRTTMAHVLASLALTKAALFGKSDEDLQSLPVVQSKKIEAIATIINRVSPAAYWSDPNLMANLLITTVRLPLRHGMSGHFAYFYAAYGLILCRIGEIDEGYRFGEVGLAVLERFKAMERAARTLFTFNCFVKHWKDPAVECLKGFLEGYRISLETGDLEFAGYHIMGYCYTSFWVSDDLFALEKETAKYIDEVAAIKQQTPLHVIRMDHQRLLNLIYPSKDPKKLVGPSYDEDAMAPIHAKARDRTALFAANSRSAQLSYFFGDYEGALCYTKRAEEEIDSVVGTIDYAIFFYYDSIIRLSFCRETGARSKTSMLRKVAANQKKLKKWARHAPANHLHRYLIVEADRVHLKGDDVEARKLFRKGIETARQNNYLLDECIAAESFSRYWYEVDEQEVGDYFLKRARDGYRTWGALAKVSHMEQKHSCLSELESGGQRHSRPALHDSSALDWSTIIKASQAISGEIVLARLLKKLMELVVENAGARKGILILEEAGELKIEARTDIEQGKVFIQEGVPVDESTALSRAIVHYVHRRREAVLLGNAPYEGLFMSDAYISKQRPRSVLCAPIINQENLSAILYLENDLTIDAFSPERLEIINLLSSQIAISIDNAVLFEKMKAAEENLRVQNEAIRNQNQAMEYMLKELQRTYDDLNKANEKKESIRKYLQNIIDSMPSVLIGVDEQMAISLWNSEAEKIIGISCDAAEGESLHGVVSSLGAYTAELRAAIDDKVPQKIERIKNLFSEDDSYCDVTIYPLVADAAHGAVLRIDNVTERVQIEKLMIQTEKMMSIGGLAAGMAHEINNPLNAIVLSAHNVGRLLSHEVKRNDEIASRIGISMVKISEYVQAAEIDKMLLGIEKMGGRAAKIIENTLNYSRRSESEMKPVDLRNLIEESLELASKDYDLRKNFDFRNVQIVRDYSDEISYVPCVDTEIIQVLLNLTRNAVQAMMDNKGSRERPRIIIRLYPERKYAKIEVEDNGPGIPANCLERVFEPFYTTKKAGVGTGLGLSVSHYIVTENHKGKIDVSSTLGKGTIFSIMLPMNKS